MIAHWFVGSRLLSETTNEYVVSRRKKTCLMFVGLDMVKVCGFSFRLMFEGVTKVWTRFVQGWWV